jgi:hypothetical protein
MQQVLNDLLICLASFDCRGALTLLADSVAEYEQHVEISDHVWCRKAVLPHPPDEKVADFAAKRRQAEAAKPSQNPVG